MSSQCIYTKKKLDLLASQFDNSSAEQVLTWAFHEFHPRMLLACSFGGVSGMALLDMAVKIEPRVRVFCLDTDFLFPETYVLLQEAEQRYSIRVEVYKPEYTPSAQASKFGDRLWAKDPDLCCRLRKVEPNRRALEGALAWVSGLRRDQGATRVATPVVQWDENFQVVKVNPLASWTEAEVWDYIRQHRVPYNSLLDRGYRSIGCTYCTRPVVDGKDPRAGRWKGFDKTECGLHMSTA